MADKIKLPDNYAATVAVWGKKHIKRFLEHTLPSLLTPGNLSSLQETGRFTFYLYALKEEYDAYFISNPIWQSFLKHYSLSFESLAEVWNQFSDIAYRESSPIYKMIAAHNHFGRKVDDGKTVMFFLGSDAIYSKNCHQFFLQKLSLGYHAIAALALRVSEPGVLKEIKKITQFRDDKRYIEAEPSLLASIFKRHMHVEYKTSIMNREEIQMGASAYFWEDSSGDYVVRSFHRHPVMVWPQVPFCYDKHIATIDDSFIHEVVAPSQIYYQKSTFEFFIICPSEEGKISDYLMLKGYPSIDEIATARLHNMVDLRSMSGILNPFILSAETDEVQATTELTILVQKSMADAQRIVTAKNGALRLMVVRHFSKIERTFPDGVVLNGGTQVKLNAIWIMKNLPDSIRFVIRQPKKLLLYIVMHPIKFFSPSRINKAKPSIA